MCLYSMAFLLISLKVDKLKRDGYSPISFYEKDEELKQCINQIRDGHFSADAPDRFSSLVDSLLVHGDRFCLLADYRAYVDMQVLFLH